MKRQKRPCSLTKFTAKECELETRKMQDLNFYIGYRIADWMENIGPMQLHSFEFQLRIRLRLILKFEPSWHESVAYQQCVDEAAC
jgi:hypothetical protein